MGAISRHSLLLASEKLSAKHLSLLFLTLTMTVAWTEDAMPVLDYASFFLMVESRLRIAWSCLPQKPQNFVSIFGFFFVAPWQKECNSDIFFKSLLDALSICNLVELHIYAISWSCIFVSTSFAVSPVLFLVAGFGILV